MASCKLAQFAPTGHGECGGPLERAHMIRQQVIRRELRLAKPKRRGSKEQRRAFVIVWDPRVWVWACRRHHEMMDKPGVVALQVPGALLPLKVRQYAAEHGLGWWVDKRYGEAA